MCTTCVHTCTSIYTGIIYIKNVCIENTEKLNCNFFSFFFLKIKIKEVQYTCTLCYRVRVYMYDASCTHVHTVGTRWIRVYYLLWYMYTAVCTWHVLPSVQYTLLLLTTIHVCIYMWYTYHTHTHIISYILHTYVFQYTWFMKYDVFYACTKKHPDSWKDGCLNVWMFAFVECRSAHVAPCFV